ncbi:MAG TPA: aspartate dehydrogenase domain-containing protein [bacterium]|nr:aspartate dehydrogenase domain-containing protein [bacterium]
MFKIKVGIIGCGVIGSSLAKIIENRFKNKAQLAWLCDHHFPKAAVLQKALKSKPVITDSRNLIRKADLIVEAASARVSGSIAREAVARGKDVLILSVGGLLSLCHPEAFSAKQPPCGVAEGSPRFFAQHSSPLGSLRMTDSGGLRMTRNKGRLWIPSGAIAGVDALLASREAGLKSVKLVTRKPPAGLSEAPYFKNKNFPKLAGSREYCVFKGNAADAVRNFPQNINVAALLSLAGLGPKKTLVEIWTSNAYQGNQHEVTIVSNAGEIRTVSKNVPFPENLKTSALAAYSAAALLRKIFSGFRVGT